MKVITIPTEIKKISPIKRIKNQIIKVSNNLQLTKFALKYHNSKDLQTIKALRTIKKILRTAI